ncbi:MAG: penicillin acylase family protein [Candidatus Binatia bacterium]
MQGTILIPGLEEKVKILWDPFAIPHVFATNEHDLFMAQGYLHAQERLWQMDINRRFLTGRLAETLGERTLPWKELSIRFKDNTTVDLDYFVRLVGIRRTACASLSLLPEDSLDLLRAYSEGVNRYIETHLNSLPVEFRLLRYHPDPWRPEDSLTIGKGFAFLLSTSLFTRLTISALSDKLKGQEKKIKSLIPRYPEWGPCITRYNPEPFSQASQELLRFLNGTFQGSQWGAAGHGSNNWVIAPRRSSTGKPILCNDPHLRMSLPPVWYLIHLKAEPERGQKHGFEVWGASIPGSPCIHLGHNRHIAWGVTAALCDDADLYREKIHPEAPDRYLVGNEWKKMEYKEEHIRIRGEGQVKKKIRITRHGPVISDLTQKSPVEEVMALKWTAHDPSEEFRVLYGVNRARDWNGFLESLSYQTAPTLNYVYADTDGNIGYSLAGRIPLRSYPPSFTPLPGWSGDFEWQGHVPFDELPRLYNPPEGIIATANNRIADLSYPYYLSDLFDPPYRIQRIKELLTAKDRLSLDDMVDIQTDVVSVQAKGLIAILRADLEETARKDISLRKAIERLTQWDGNCRAGSPEAALYHIFYQRLMINLLGPALGQDLLLAYSEIFNQSLAPTDLILGDPQSPWFVRHSRLSLVEKSIQEAEAELTARLGDDPDGWKWGKIHTLTLEHPLGRARILAPFFSIGPFPAPGDAVTINSGFYRHSYPYRQVVGASLRMVITPEEWERSQFILPSGQSGHPLSRYYRDQVELWQCGKYIRLAYSKEEMEGWPTLTLTPLI